MLWRLRTANQRWRRYSPLLVKENRWRAQRYGIDQGLVDFGRGSIVPFGELVEEILGLVAEDADFFGCTAEVEHARTIMARGTSSHWQVETFEKAMADGASREQAHRAVVDMLIERTRPDVDIAGAG